MRTTAPVVFVLALGVAFAIVGATGIAGIWGVQDAPGGDRVEGNLKDNAGDSPAGNDDTFDGQVGRSGGETNLIGLVISGLGILASAAAAIVLLPLTLTDLGFPAYAAFPIGLFLQVIVGIGIVEFASGREWT